MKAYVSIACIVAVIGFTNVASAQGKGGPKVKTTSGATAVHGGGAHGKSATYKPSAPKAATKTTTKTVAAKAPKATTAHGSGHATTADVRTTPRTGNTSTTTTTTTTTTGTTLTPVQQKLQKNTNLASKLQSRLPAGTDLNTAAAGFRNLGQFVAAVNVSNNLGLDFPTLKTAMVTDGKSLGQAIQAQKGTEVNATVEAQHAERDANTMIGSTEKKGKSSTSKNRQ